MRYNPADDVEEYELLSGSTLKGVILFGGVLVAGFVALRLYEKERAKDSTQSPRMIKIPIQLPNNVVKKPS